MKSMICLFLFALVAIVSANPGGLTGVPHGAVPLSLGLGHGIGHGIGHVGHVVAPVHQPIAPAVIRHAQPIHAAVGHGPLPLWNAGLVGHGVHGIHG